MTCYCLNDLSFTDLAPDEVAMWWNVSIATQNRVLMTLMCLLDIKPIVDELRCQPDKFMLSSSLETVESEDGAHRKFDVAPSICSTSKESI